jgi:hypothetical protein
MGTVLQAIQGVCQAAGCALLVVTHWNKTGDSRGADRISGAGPAAWARVICSVSIQHRSSNPDGASTVLLGVELIGGEIADTGFRIRRRIRAEDPADLGSPLSYAVEVLAADDTQDWTRPRPPCPSPASGSWLPCGPAGNSRRSSSWGTGWPRPVIR